jgi:hypothetical protein
MAAAQVEKDIELAQEAVTKQGDSVRSLKALLKDGKAEKVVAVVILSVSAVS